MASSPSNLPTVILSSLAVVILLIQTTYADAAPLTPRHQHLLLDVKPSRIDGTRVVVPDDHHQQVNRKKDWSKCSYNVEIKTSCRWSAGTDDEVSVKFGDKYGREVQAFNLHNPSSNDFERCARESFLVTGPCLDVICYLRVKRSGDDNWRMESARVIYDGRTSDSLKPKGWMPNHTWVGFDNC